MAAAIGALLLGGFLFWGCSTTPTAGVVDSATWKHTVHLDRWTQTTHDGFKKDTRTRVEREPVGGKGESAGMELIGGSCRIKSHPTREEKCGTREECEQLYRTESYSCDKTRTVSAGTRESCTTRNMGNGFKEEVCVDIPQTKQETYTGTCTREVPDGQRCWDVDVYCATREQYCSYRTQKWSEVDARTAQGTHTRMAATTAPSWPALTPGRLDRLRYSSSYALDVEYAHKGKQEHYNYTPIKTLRRANQSSALENERAFNTWKVGEPMTVMVTNFGPASSVRRGAPE